MYVDPITSQTFENSNSYPGGKKPQKDFVLNSDSQKNFILTQNVRKMYTLQLFEPKLLTFYP